MMSAIPNTMTNVHESGLAVLRDLVSGGGMSTRLYALPRVARAGGEETVVLRVISKDIDEVLEN